MPSLFHSETELYLNFPDLHTVELRTKKNGEGSVEYLAKTVEPTPPGALHVLDVAHKASPASYRVVETADKKYVVSIIGNSNPSIVGFTTTMEVEGLFHGKHVFQGPSNDHFIWSGKGDKLELVVKGDDENDIADFIPDDRLLQLKKSRFGKHRDVDTEFVIATFFALLLFQDEYNHVKDSQDVLGRARGRTWKERAELATRPKVAEASSALAGASAYVSNLTGDLTKKLQETAASFQEKK
ncbi:hypothetical protein T439DRAFT_324922 [Meredithblackwellia eburnea MCA 4105]